MALGCQVGKDKARSRCRDDPRLTTELRRTIALTFDHRGHGGIVGIDHFTVTPFLALGEILGLLTDLLMMTHRSGEGLTEPLTLGLTQCRRLAKILSRFAYFYWSFMNL